MSVANLVATEEAQNGFYPTPPRLAEKLLEGIEWSKVADVLEPEAGKGNIVRAVAEKYMVGARYGDPNINIDCIEIDPYLRSILQYEFCGAREREILDRLRQLKKKQEYNPQTQREGELSADEELEKRALTRERDLFDRLDLHIIHDNFLTFQSRKHYDLVAMNPPFANGDEHLLKAIEIQHHGGGMIRCILNAETIRNPYTNRRRFLVRKLTELEAKIEYIKEAFSDGERSTDVEVALIKINIPVQKRESTIFDRLRRAAEVDEVTPSDVTDLTVEDFMSQIVSRFNVEVDAGIELIREYGAMKPYILESFDEKAYCNYPTLTLCVGDPGRLARGSVPPVNKYLRLVRAKYWEALFSNKKFVGKLTSNLREEYMKKVTAMADYDFTLFNIQQIAEQMNAEMGSLYEIGTDVFSGMNDFVKANPGIVKGVAAGAAVIGTVTLALTGYAAGAKIAAAASLLLSASIPGVNVILGVTAAVAGITAGVVALSSAANAGVPSVKELTEAARDMEKTMREANATYQETATQTLATAEVAGVYIDKLEEIEAATDGNVQGNQEYHNILALLTRTIPELADDIDLTTDSINGGTEALRAHTDAWKKDAETQAYQEYINSLYDQYGEVMAESAENSIKLTQAQIKLENAEKNQAAVLERLDELARDTTEDGGMLTDEYNELKDALYRYNNEIYTAEREIKNLNKAMDADAQAVAAAEAEIEDARAAVERLTGATREQNGAEAQVAAQTQELQTLINDTAGEVLALAEAYEEAYGAALKSVSGQYDLWDEAAAVVATSSWSINSALESQISYWQDYNKNLESLTERSGDIEGLNDLIASFADGSADSVNAIAGLADASDDELRKMVDNWQELQEEQKAVSDSIAQIAVDIPGQMQQIEDSMRESISEMEFSDEAAKSAHDAIQAFIDQADNMMPMVQDAYGKLGAAANNALAGRFSYNSQGINNYYASGTESAAPGLAMVGERGPELVYFRGGEKVLNAEQTASALQAQSSRDSTSPLSITFQIGGNATPEVVQDLRNFAGEIVEQVMDAIAEKEEDAQRRAY